jgi:hypothetical protein
LKPCIKKALADIETNNFYDEENFKILEDVLKVLKPTELAVKELSKEDSTVLTSEGVFKFLFKNLADQSSDLSQEMLEALRKRYDERRNKDLVSLMRYLQNPEIKQGDDEFKYSSKSSIINYVISIIKQNFFSENEVDFPLESSNEEAMEETNDLSVVTASHIIGMVTTKEG